MTTSTHNRTLLGLLLVALATSCGPDPKTVAATALDQDFGALTEDATLPADAPTDAAVNEQEESEGPSAEAADSGAPTLPADLEAKTQSLFALRLAWGNFPVNPDLRDQPIDYSGSITISNGSLLRVRGVRLERQGQGDGIVRPRTDEAVVELASTITTAVDGVHMLVAAYGDDASLTITLGNPVQYQETIALAGLKELAKATPSATAKQEVRIGLHRVRKTKTDRCTSGTLSGRWLHASTPGGREFNKAGGFLLNDAGERVGRFFAIAGTNQKGEPVLFVKLLSHGHFLARGKGTFDANTKTFTATLLRGGQEVGSLSGAYTEVSANAGYGEVSGSFAVGACEQ